MSNEAAFYQDPYLKELESTVVSVDGNQLVLNDTIFYPTGGGQPGDTGSLYLSDGTVIAITNTRRCRETRQIIHEFEADELAVGAGDNVRLELDWDRRFAHMRLHTCMHLLCSVLPYGVTGGGLTDQKARVDFAISGELPNKEELTDALNELIQKALPVTIEMLDDQILDEQPELVKTMSVQPPRGVGLLRMVRVQETDFQPCGGTHVTNTSEIGRVKVARVESKGKQNKRVQIVFDES